MPNDRWNAAKLAALAATAAFVLVGCLPTELHDGTRMSEETFTADQVEQSLASVREPAPTGLQAYGGAGLVSIARPDLSSSGVDEGCAWVSWALAGFSPVDPSDKRADAYQVSLQAKDNVTPPTAAFVQVRIASTPEAAAEIVSMFDGAGGECRGKAIVDNTSYEVSSHIWEAGLYTAEVTKLSGDGPAATAFAAWQYGNLWLTVKAEGKPTREDLEALAELLDTSLSADGQHP